MNYKNGGIFFSFFILIYYFSKNSIFKMIKNSIIKIFDLILKEPEAQSTPVAKDTYHKESEK